MSCNSDCNVFFSTLRTQHHRLHKESWRGQVARRLRAKFWPDCAIPDTSMKFGTVVDHDLLSGIGYRTTLGNAYCACAKHFLIFGCYHRAFIQFDFKEGVMLAVE